MHVRLLARVLSCNAEVYAQVISQGCQEGVFHTKDPLTCAEFILSALCFLTDRGISPWTENQLQRRIMAFPSSNILHLSTPQPLSLTSSNILPFYPLSLGPILLYHLIRLPFPLSSPLIFLYYFLPYFVIPFPSLLHIFFFILLSLPISLLTSFSTLVPCFSLPISRTIPNPFTLSYPFLPS